MSAKIEERPILPDEAGNCTWAVDDRPPGAAMRFAALAQGCMTFTAALDWSMITPTMTGEGKPHASSRGCPGTGHIDADSVEIEVQVGYERRQRSGSLRAGAR